MKDPLEPDGVVEFTTFRVGGGSFRGARSLAQNRGKSAKNQNIRRRVRGVRRQTSVAGAMTHNLTTVNDAMRLMRTCPLTQVHQLFVSSGLEIMAWVGRTCAASTH